MQDIILRKQQTLHTAWATPALRPSGRGGIFSGLVENMTLICRTRWSNRPLVEEGQRRTKPPMSEPPTTSRNKQKNGIRCRTNKRRERRGETKTIFSFPQKFSRSEKKKDGVGLPLASPDMLYKERSPKTNLKASESGGYLLSHNAVQYHRRC